MEPLLILLLLFALHEVPTTAIPMNNSDDSNTIVSSDFNSPSTQQKMNFDTKLSNTTDDDDFDGIRKLITELARTKMETLKNEQRSARKRRAIPTKFKKPANCVISRAEVENLSGLVREATNSIRSSDNSQLGTSSGLPAQQRASQSSTSSNSSCAEYLQQIRDHIRQIVTEWQDVNRKVRGGQLVSSSDLNAAVARIEDLQRELLKTKDDLSRDHSAAITKLTSDFTKEIQSLRSAINAYKQEIERLLKAKRDTTIELIVSEIDSAEYVNSLLKFKSLGEENLAEALGTIVRTSSSRSEDMSRQAIIAKNVLHFIWNIAALTRFYGLSTVHSLQATGYTALLSALKARNHGQLLTSPVVVLKFDLVLSDYLQTVVASEDRKRVENVRKELTPFVQPVIDDIASKVKAGELSALSNILGRGFLAYLSQVVRGAYGTYGENYHNILALLLDASIPYEDEAKGLEVMFQLLQSNPNPSIVQPRDLATRVRTILKKTSLSNEAKEKLSSIRQRMTSWATSIRWTCSIHSKFVNEYLYSPNDYHSLNRLDRLVFTWIPGVAPLESNWRFDPLDGDFKTFHIRNFYRSEWLFASSYTRDANRRYVATFKKGGWPPNPAAAKWVLESAAGGGFGIKSQYYGEYMYVGAMTHAWDSQRRRIFTRRPGGFHPDSNWDLSCQKS